MAIIETDTILFEGRSFKRQVRVNADGVFRIKLPAELDELLGKEEATGSTKSEALCNFAEVISAFNNKEVETRKVMRFKYAASSMLRERHDMNDITFCRGVGLTVSAIVLTETKTTTGSGKVSYSYERDSDAPIGDSIYDAELSRNHYDRSKPHEGLLDWTPELELFFKDLNDSMETLIIKVHKIMQDDKSLLTFAKSNMKLLSKSDQSMEPTCKGE